MQTSLARSGLTLGGIAGLALLILGATSAVFAQEMSVSEYSLKAAFLHNFAKYVEWPAEALAEPAEKMVLCLLGEDPFGDVLGEMEGRSVRGRQIVIDRAAELDDLERCHILFVCRSKKERLDGILGQLAGVGVLTVSDISGFAERGGMIEMLADEEVVRITINLGATQREGLVVSSRLLALARITEDSRRKRP
jgi:hypothetical protein